MPRITITLTHKSIAWLSDTEQQEGRTVAAAARRIIEEAELAAQETQAARERAVDWLKQLALEAQKPAVRR